jgi:hypothetical protein
MHDGRSVQRTLVSQRVLAAGTARVVAVGTRPKPRPQPVIHRTSVDGLDWPALASCESGGNPRAVGGGGAYFGLYQFSLSTWQAVGGSGNPVDASSAEQTYRAKLLYLRSGADVWPTCGQRLYS